jgi:hypothetical protein
MLPKRERFGSTLREWERRGGGTLPRNLGTVITLSHIYREHHTKVDAMSKQDLLQDPTSVWLEEHRDGVMFVTSQNL